MQYEVKSSFLQISSQKKTKDVSQEIAFHQEVKRKQRTVCPTFCYGCPISPIILIDKRATLYIHTAARYMTGFPGRKTSFDFLETLQSD